MAQRLTSIHAILADHVTAADPGRFGHRDETQALRAALEQAHGENLQLRRELTRLGWNGQLAAT